MHKLIILILLLSITACVSMRGKIDYKFPSEDYIDIKGNMVEQLTYKVRVEYVTKSDSKKCKNYHWVAGRHISQKIKFEYLPTIANSKHSLHIPLKELDPSTECNWQPSTVFICVSETGTEANSCGSLFFLSGEHDNNSEINLECRKFCFRTNGHTEHINILNKTYSVNISQKNI